jgi:hypothetical protein
VPHKKNGPKKNKGDVNLVVEIPLLFLDLMNAGSLPTLFTSPRPLQKPRPLPTRSFSAFEMPFHEFRAARHEEVHS